MGDNRYSLRFLLNEPEEDDNPLREVYNVNLPNNLFNQIHNAQPPRNRNGARWMSTWIPFRSPQLSQFSRRLEVRFNPQDMVPVPSPPEEAMDEEELRQFFEGNGMWTIVGNFVNEIQRRMQELEDQNDEETRQIRMYMVHENGRLTGVDQHEYASANRSNPIFDIGRGWQNRLKRILAMALSSFSDTYSLPGRGNLAAIRVYVDFSVVRAGGARSRNQGVPDWMPLPLQEFIFNPIKKDCFIKCIQRKIDGNHHELKRLMGGDLDKVDYRDVAKKFIQVFPGWGLRICGHMLNPNVIADGEEFKTFTYLDKKKRVIWLVLANNHYILVTDPQKYLEIIRAKLEYLCIICGKIYGTSMGLSTCNCCPASCDKCGRYLLASGARELHRLKNNSRIVLACENCHRSDFYSEECLTFHTIACGRANINTVIARDVELQQVASRPNNQAERQVRQNKYKQLLGQSKRSGTYHCYSCQKHVYMEAVHVCYMEENKLPKELKIKKWYAFDYESMLTAQGGSDLHQVNLVCVQELFVRPFKRWTFKTLDEFFTWIRTEIYSMDVVVGFVAHNLKGYDGRLTLARLFQLKEEITDMMWKGNKIQTFKWLERIEFRDSLLHITQPLASFPKVFGLDEMHKGYFPYKFNTPERQNYVGPIPDLKFYDPQFKSPKERKALIKWHAENADKEYNFQEELVKYCISDTDILAQGLEKYYVAGQELNHEMLPPMENLTAASYTMNCWRTLHFTENTLCYHGYIMEKNAREALRGGRTDVRVFYKKWTIEDVFVKKKYGKYVDVQSMYPYVMYTKPVPVGKPKLTYDAQEIGDLFGFACVDLQPPDTYVHHPPIVHKVDKKLVAHLKPWIKTVFTTVEINDAIAKGWKLTRIHWIQAYEQNSDLFKDYVRKLVTEKIHSSSGPPEDFEELAAEWRDRYDLKLERNKMEFNAGKRAISKLQVNSLWGKFAENPHTTKSKYVDAVEYVRLEERELAGEIKFKNMTWMAEERWLLDYDEIVHRSNEGTIYEDSNNLLYASNRKRTNVALAAFVTMWGRRMLWEEMDRLGRRTIYHDTDSIIYEYIDGEYNTPLGRCLGDWEDELPGKPIVEFIALAPKTYGYRYLDTGVEVPEGASDEWFQQYQPYEEWEGKIYPIREEVKVKGFSLHSEARGTINFDGLLSLLRKEKTHLDVRQLQFLYARNSGEITTKIGQKSLIMDYEKGVVGDDLHGYPYGFEAYIPGSSGVVEEGSLRRRRQRDADDDLE